MQFCPFGKLFEDRMQIRIAQAAQIGDIQAEAGKRVGHDRTVAADLGGTLAHQFEVGALAGRSTEANGEIGDGIETDIVLGILPLVHDMDNVVHETIQSDKRRQIPDAW